MRIKLWYSVADNKISVLREIKLMRLEVAALSGRAVSETEEPIAGSSLRLDELSRIERWGWLFLLFLLMFLIGARMSGYMSEQGAGNAESNRPVTLETRSHGLT